MRKTFIHISPYGKGYNIGNFAISLAIRKLLNRLYENPVIVSIPAHGMDNSGLNKKVIFEANNCADGIIVGGGNLYENNELDVDFNALEALSVPLVLYSISIGRIYAKTNRLARRTDRISDKKLKLLHSYASTSLARDAATYEYIKDLGCTNVSMGACPTIQLSNLLDISDKNVSRENIYLSVRKPELMNIPTDIKLEMPSLIRSFSKILYDKYGKKPILLCHDQRDLEFASSFKDHDYYFTPDVYEYLSLIANAKLVVSFRVHATLPSLSYDTPVINLSYDERGISLLNSIGYSSWDINLVEQFDSIYDVLQERLENLNELYTLKAKNKDLWSSLVSTQEAVLSDFI